MVDVGCGTGGNIGALVKDYTCVGIDTNAEAITRARSRFPKVRFLLGHAPHDLGNLMRQGKLFLLMDVLEHVPDDFQLLSELLAAAKPGTLFFMTVPANESLWSEHDESFGHYRRYDCQRFERLWAGLPVSTLLVSHFNTRMYPVIRAVRAWNRLRGQTSGPVGTDFRMPPGPVNRLLEATFAGEGKILEDLLDGRRRRGYRMGASLMAVVRRESGPIDMRGRPDDVAKDDHCLVTV